MFPDPEAQLHVRERKVRLRPEDDDLLRALARRLDIPPAVLARKFIRDGLGLHGLSVASDASDRRPA